MFGLSIINHGNLSSKIFYHKSSHLLVHIKRLAWRQIIILLYILVSYWTLDNCLTYNWPPLIWAAIGRILHGRRRASRPASYWCSSGLLLVEFYLADEGHLAKLSISSHLGCYWLNFTWQTKGTSPSFLLVLIWAAIGRILPGRRRAPSQDWPIADFLLVFIWAPIGRFVPGIRRAPRQAWPIADFLLWPAPAGPAGWRRLGIQPNQR